MPKEKSPRFKVRKPMLTRITVLALCGHKFDLIIQGGSEWNAREEAAGKLCPECFKLLQDRIEVCKTVDRKVAPWRLLNIPLDKEGDDLVAEIEKQWLEQQNEKTTDSPST